MTNPKPFRPSEAKEAFTDLVQGDFMLPFCVPGAEILMGEDLAVLVVLNQEGQRLGLPMDLRAVADLHALLGEALRTMQAPEGGSVQ
jgi:hypothetical protein